VSDDTAIGWTDKTFNPWWGCARVSPACAFCYADTWARRTGETDLWRRHGRRRIASEAYWRKPLQWNREAEIRGRPFLVFCASMADVFEDHPALPEPRRRLWALIEDTPWLTWQLLTKRPENVLWMVPGDWLGERYRADAEWPANVWVGTSVETQQWAEARIPHLLRIPAAVRFLSCEPLLGPVDLTGVQIRDRRFVDALTCDYHDGAETIIAGPPQGTGPVGWVIAGGESGGPWKRALVMDGRIPGYRGELEPKPGALRWVRDLRDQVLAARVPFYFKQWGGATWRSGGRELDGRTWDQIPEPVAVSP
jgi:protein gp37